MRPCQKKWIPSEKMTMVSKKISKQQNMSDFYQKISPILDEIQNIQKWRASVYIHCSKINSLLQNLRQVPVCIEDFEKPKKGKKHTISFKNRNAIGNITSAIEQTQYLANQCVKDTCVHYLLSQSVRNAKKEIKAIRETLHYNFSLLKLNTVAALFKISKEEFKSQDLVDMKRISQILTQLSLKNRDDVADKIAQRFKSLKKLGIKTEPGEKHVLTIPELPQNIQFIIKHEDVQIGKEIGSGQSGSVHVGTFKNIEVAVKILTRRALTIPELESFKREIYALTVLNHPNLLKFYGYTEEPPFLILTEYMPNGSVFQILRKSPQFLTPTIRSLIALDVARGLDYLHQRNIIHRDLKSLNVLLDKNYRAKICDFGMVSVNSSAPKTGLIGTAHWMAPEVLMSSPKYDNKVDVYSYGIFLWELLTGDMPYATLKPADIISKVMDGGRPELPDTVNGQAVPAELKDLIVKCWAQEPLNRPTITKVINAFDSPNIRFPGTDEAEFREAAGIYINFGKHKSSISMPYQSVAHRRMVPGRKYEIPSGYVNNQPTGIDILDFSTLVEALKNSDKSTREDIFDRLFKAFSEQSKEEIKKEGFFNAICETLDDHNDSSDFLMSRLLECKSPNIFDVKVLQSLLSYSAIEDEGLRSKALSVLIRASDLQFDFLKNSPSFINKLLQFITHPLALQLSSSLLQLVKRLLNASSFYPNGTLQILFQAKDQLAVQLQPAVVSCIAASLKFNDAKTQLTREILTDCLKDLSNCLPIFEAYAVEDHEKFSNDVIFVSLLFSSRSNNDIYNLLVLIASKPRFINEIIDLLPLGFKPSRCVKLYKSIFSFKEYIPRLAEIKEFYNVLDEMLANDEYELACSTLRSIGTPKQDIVQETHLCKRITDLFNESESDNVEIMLMGCIYALCKDNAYYAVFDALFPKIWNLMINGDPNLKLPSYLSIVAISHFKCQPNIIGKSLPMLDIPKLFVLSAQYVSYNSTISRELAASFLKRHIYDHEIDLNLSIQCFIDNYVCYHDNIEKAVIHLLKKASKNNQNVSKSLRKQLRSLTSANGS